MIDLHTHILPGIDDGSDTMEDSLEMAMIAAQSGVEVLVATPHSNQEGRFENFFTQSLIDLFLAFQQLVKEEHIGTVKKDVFHPLQLRLGMEIFASYDLKDKLKQQKLIGLNGSRFCLVEWAFDEHPDAIDDYLSMILQTGKVPLIAHPERYYCVQDYPELVYEWLRMGCYTQLNKGSVFGRFGRHAKSCADILLENDLITCVSTDAHSPRMRTTFMGDARDYFLEEYGREKTVKLLQNNAALILTDKLPAKHGRRPEFERKLY